MKSKKKPTLADVQSRMAQWLASYIGEHELLPLGKRVELVVEVSHYQTTMLYNASLKITHAWPRASNEPMTKEDWEIIFGLPCFRSPVPDSLYGKLLEWVRQLSELKDEDKPLGFPYAHASRINNVFDSNGLLYHVFCVAGSTSAHNRPPKFKIYKKF